MRREADALGLAAGEGGGGAVELEVAESDLIEEVESLHDLGEDVAADFQVASGKLERLGFLESVLNCEGGEIWKREFPF